MLNYLKLCILCVCISGILTPLHSAENIYKKPSVYANGLFVRSNDTHDRTVVRSGYRTLESENGRFICTFQNDYEKIRDFRCYENGTLLFSLPQTNSNSVTISNIGFVVFTGIDYSHRNAVSLTFYAKDGKKLYNKRYEWPQTSGFSAGGSFFGISTDKKLDIINITTGDVASYRDAVEFDVSNDGKVVVVSYKNGVTIYSEGTVISEFNNGFIYHRGIKISPDKTRFAVADIKNLHTYSLPDCKLIHADKLPENEYFREFLLDNNTLWAGVKFEQDDIRKGILKTYTFGMRAVSGVHKEEITSEIKKTSRLDIKKFRETFKTENQKFPPIPWPFEPQDEAHNAWNNYEGHISSSNGANSSAYMHNGFDIDVNANENCYSVDTGTVKYRGDLNWGAKYWRIAVGKNSSTQLQTAWLYAHLVQSSINYGTGERVTSVGEHLADIIQWEPQNGVDAHIHFCNIEHSGNPWVYTSSNQWDLTYNPHVSLRPNPDSTAPTIETAISSKSKFAYCRNNLGLNGNSGDYFDPDSAAGGLDGDIDIIVKLYDIIVYKKWYQPAYRLYYWIKGIDPVNCWSNYNKLIIDTTLSVQRNHAFEFFAPEEFTYLSRVLYKADNVFQVGGWFTQKKSFHHIVTNTNGDTLLTESEANYCVKTADYYDGWYRVYVKACDLAGNFAVDSEDVYFNNGNPDPTPLTNMKKEPVSAFYLGQAVPFGNVTSIQFHIPEATMVSLKVYDLLGNEIKTLASGVHRQGRYMALWDGTNRYGKNTGAGLYMCRLQTRDFVATRKMQYCK
jgi:hypothetical protein